MSGRRPTALRLGALKRWPPLGAGVMPAHQRPGVCLAKAKASGRVDVYTRGSQGSVCVTTPTAGQSRYGYLGFVLGMAHGVAYGFVLGSTFHKFDKRQQRLTTNGSTRQHAQASGGGRLHPGPAGERLHKQRPKLFSCLSWRPCDRWCLRDDEPGSGSELEGMFSALRSIACLIACPPCPCSVFSWLFSPS